MRCAIPRPTACVRDEEVLLLLHEHFLKEVTLLLGSSHGFRMYDLQAHSGMRYAFPPYGYEILQFPPGQGKRDHRLFSSPQRINADHGAWRRRFATS